MKRYFFMLLAMLAGLLVSCEDKNPHDVSFSYAGIIDKEYRFNVGRVIPLTINQAIETDGDISPDGKYFYYTSNIDSGNFDIYCRAMNSSVTLRLTGHPSRDTNPVISPDGETIAFVSFRDDPEGDILKVDVDPGKLFDKYTYIVDGNAFISRGSKSSGITDTLDEKSVNLTTELTESGVSLAVRDVNPVWSPDGKYIAWSRTRSNQTDIWLMKKNGKDKKQLTTGGGDYPSFSPDGKNIVYVSYKESSNGDICVIDTESGKTSKVQGEEGLKLYPCFAGAGDKYIYSLISKDTNRNGRLDLDDRAVLMLLDTGQKLSYRLTKESVSSFKGKWLPSVTTRDYKGIILYTDITGENINLNMIPETGIIPKKNNAKLQLELCNTYIEEWDDPERYEMALDAVFFFFGSSNESSSMIYADRALGMASAYYINTGRKHEAEHVISRLKRRAGEKNPYASIQLRIAENLLAGKKGFAVDTLGSLRGEKSKAVYIPFALEDIADYYSAAGEKDSALDLYREILKKYTDYERAIDLHVKISLNEDDLRTRQLSESAVKVLTSGSANQRISVIRNLAAFFQKGEYSSSNAAFYLKNIIPAKEKYREDKKVSPVLKYIAGLIMLKTGDTENALNQFKEALEITPKNDIISHLSSIVCGDIERKRGDFSKAEKYYNEGFDSHSRRFRTDNLKDRLLWLVDYYEEGGKRFSASGKYMEAASFHEKNFQLLTKMHNKRLFPEIYSLYAARAHVQYIDAWLNWKGEKSIVELEKTYAAYENTALYKMDFNRAAIYGLAYLYTRKALYLENSQPADSEINTAPLVVQALAKSDEWIEWALFLDDTFIEPYLLKSWNYQFIDSRRTSGSATFSKESDRFFPQHLWEASIPVLEKAVTVNDEAKSPENEGNLNLNMANSYFLLQNYPRALKHYQLAAKYKKNFGNEIEQALFHFHYGYSCWQNNDTATAREEINRAYGIYRSMAAGRPGAYAEQYLVLYRYFALFSRYEGKYSEAIKWYRTILDFAAENRLEIDRARYLQEIAQCYINIGDTDTAMTFINQAGQLLKNYPDDTRKNYVKWKVMGIIPFSFFDMGEDSLVVGESSIFNPLDTFSKKLLNLSMLEEISVKKNDYAGAIKQLNGRIKLAEEKDSGLAKEIIVRALNNIGYYSCRVGRYTEAEKRFTDAAKQSEETGYQEGMFTSMMNLVNLYSIMIEEKMDRSRDWLKVTGSAIEWMQGYRESYYEAALKQEMDDLEKKADAAKRDVTQDEKDAAELKVKHETDEINYRVDIALSILKFHRAELLYEKARPGKDAKDGAYNLYLSNREIFNIYREALEGFETALTVPATKENPELQCRLLINTGVCCSRIGDNEKAYVSLLDAKTIAEKYELRWLKVSVYYALGSFMWRYGSEVEKGDASSLAEKYFSQGLGIAENHPLLVVSHAERVRNLYGEYIQFLAASGKIEKAFYAGDRCAQFTRIALVNSVSPVFRNSYDRRIYYDYTAAVGELSASEDEISALLKTGVLPDSPAIMALRKKLDSRDSKLTSMYEMAENYNRLVSSYLEISSQVMPVAGYSIYMFQDTPAGMLWIKEQGKKINSGYLAKGDLSSFNRLLQNDGDKPVFILLNESVLSMIRGGMEPGHAYSLIGSLDRVEYYLKDTNSITGEVLSVTGFDGTASGVRVTRWNDKLDPADFSTVVSTDEKQAGTDPASLFSSGISPACIIRAGVNYDSSSMLLLGEAALYAGTTRLLFTSKEDSSLVAESIASVYRQESGRAGGVLVYGYIKTTSPEKKDTAKIAENEYSLFTSSLSRLELAAARGHLARWYSMSGSSAKQQYYLNLWLIAVLGGDYEKSADIINSMKPETAGETAAAAYMNICQLIYTGKIAQARSEFNKLQDRESMDSRFINIVLSLAENGDVSVIRRAAEMKRPYTTMVPAERYIFLMLSYALLVSDEAAREAAALLPQEIATSEREMLLLRIIAGKKGLSGLSVRSDAISAIADGEVSGRLFGEAAAGLITADSGYDRLSAYPVILMLRFCKKDPDVLRFLSAGDVVQAAGSADPLDSLLLLNMACHVYIKNADYDSAIAVNKEMLRYSGAAPFILAGIYSDAAMTGFFSGDYRGGYEAGLEAEKINSARGRSDSSLELLMVNILTITGQYDEAAERAGRLKGTVNFNDSEKYLFDIQLTLIELNRLSRLKKATVNDAAEFERLFGSILNMLRDNPSLAAGRQMEFMTTLVFDKYIDYRMKTGNYGDAHYYSEVKKLVLASVHCNINLLKKSDAMAMEKLGNSISGDSVFINIAKVSDDLFVWTIDSKEKKAVIIPSGYTTATKIISSYESNATAGKDLSTVSKELQLLFASIYPSIKNKKRIILCTDSFTEKIPFEISGETSMLIEKYRFGYVASPLLFGKSAAGVPAQVHIVSYNEKEQGDYLERAAIREAGVPFTITENAGGGATHVAGRVIYSQRDMLFRDDRGVALDRIALGSRMLYVAPGNLNGASVTDLVLAAEELCSGEVVVNSSILQDVNTADFIRSFYSGIFSGAGSEESFSASINELRNGGFRHPANWSGIRLYVRSLTAAGN